MDKEGSAVRGEDSEEREICHMGNKVYCRMYEGHVRRLWKLCDLLSIQGDHPLCFGVIAVSIVRLFEVVSLHVNVSWKVYGVSDTMEKRTCLPSALRQTLQHW